MSALSVGPRWKIGLIVAVLVAVGVVGALFVSDRPACPEGSVFHQPAANCIDPRALLVTGPYEEVTAVAAQFGGWANHRQEGSRTVVLPLDDPDELERLKEALEDAGFKVQYRYAYTLQ